LLNVKLSYKEETLYATVAVTLDIFFFVYVNLRCIANNQKKNVDFPLLPLKKFLPTPVETIICFGKETCLESRMFHNFVCRNRFLSPQMI